jgi:ABC-type spermidine/putrescine transport system permease subunit II
MRSRWGALYVGLILLLLALPLIVVAGVSLNGGQSLRFPAAGPLAALVRGAVSCCRLDRARSATRSSSQPWLR